MYVDQQKNCSLFFFKNGQIFLSYTILNYQDEASNRSYNIPVGKVVWSGQSSPGKFLANSLFIEGVVNEINQLLTQ